MSRRFQARTAHSDSRRQLLVKWCQAATVVLGLSSVVACDNKTHPKSKASANARSSVTAHQSATSPKQRQPAEPMPCRALQVTGKVTLDNGEALDTGTALDGERWLELATGSRITVRHAKTAREYAISGPAQVLPCRAGEEEVLLGEGEFRGSAGGGARPGAMVIVATPLGTLTYNNADLTIRSMSRASALHLDSGSAWLDAGPGARRIGSNKLTGPKAKGQLVRGANYSVERIIDHCEGAATKAQTQAVELMKKPGQDGIGAAAAKHMLLRSAARRACRVAEAALRLAPEPKLQLLSRRVAAANTAWKRIPARRSAEQK